jgi:hypothetical protein
MGANEISELSGERDIGREVQQEQREFGNLSNAKNGKD